MTTTRETIDYFSHTLDSYIIASSNNPKTKSNTATIDTLIKLKIALNNYTKTIKELISLENGEPKDKRHLGLSCATVISQQVDNDIVKYIETNWEKDGKPSSSVVNNSENEVCSLMEDVLETTKDLEVVIRKYKWASGQISDA